MTVLLLLLLLCLARPVDAIQNFVQPGGLVKNDATESELTNLRTTVVVTDTTTVWFALVNLRVSNMGIAARELTIRLNVDTTVDVSTQVYVPAASTITVQLPQTFAASLSLGPHVFKVYVTGIFTFQHESYLGIWEPEQLVALPPPSAGAPITLYSFTLSGLVEKVADHAPVGADLSNCSRTVLKSPLTNNSRVWVTNEAWPNAAYLLEQGEFEPFAAPADGACGELWVTGTAGDVVSVRFE